MDKVVLNSISDPKSRSDRKRVTEVSFGTGKTAGRGHKGQKSRFTAMETWF